MPSDYRSIPPVRQFDETSCWAAALEWWARAAGRTVIDQLTLISKYERYWDSSGDPDTNPNYGTVSRENLMLIMKDACWRMACQEVRGVSLNGQYLSGKLPCILAYFEGEVGGYHAVVAFKVGDTAVSCMDPSMGAFRDFRYGRFQRSNSIIAGWPK